MNTITKYHTSISYIQPKLPSAAQALLKHAIEAYSFVMYPETHFTFQELANKIKETFDTKEPHNAAAVNVLEFSDRFTREAHNV